MKNHRGQFSHWREPSNISSVERKCYNAKMKLAVDMAKTKFAGDTPPPMKEKDGGVTKHSGSEKITINEADGGGRFSVESLS